MARAHLIWWSALLLSGCVTHSATPVLAPRALPVAVAEKLPLRTALLVTEADRDRKYHFSGGRALDRFAGEVAVARALEESLLLSLPQVVERVILVRTAPGPGVYQLLAEPKVHDARVWIESSTQGTGIDVKFLTKASLRVRDHAARELAVFERESQAAVRIGNWFVINERVGFVVSEAVNTLVRQWTEDLARSPAVAQYAATVRPALAEPGTPSRPPASDISVSITYPAESARVSEDSIAIAGLVTAIRPVQRVELVVNGRAVPLSRDVRVQPSGLQSQPFDARVPLSPGENLIVVTAVDATGRGVQAARTVFREIAAAGGLASPPKLGTGERWAVVIGIDQYRDPSISALRYATADAEAVFRFLTTRGGVKPANARLLLNKDASQRNIRQVLGDFLRQKALRDDEVIIYYAGHGTTEPDQSAEGGVAKYLVPWDADPQSLFSTAIPMEEIDRVFGRLAARKILMIQDTCFSGGAGGRTFLAKGLSVRTATLTDKFLQELTQKEGRMILTASDVNQVSQEDPALGHGIFTHYFLEALGGAADLDADGAVTVREVHLYLQRKVHERSGGAQTPQLYNIGDMVLVRK